jgi:hypothetical protein
LFAQSTIKGAQQLNRLVASTAPTMSIPHYSSQSVAALLPKLHDLDSDYRFMSLNDLHNVLSVGPPSLLLNDYNTSSRTVDGILKTLDDQNGEVQNLAVRWCAYLRCTCIWSY